MHTSIPCHAPCCSVPLGWILILLRVAQQRGLVRYMLAKELSTGELRPATTSEANDIDFRIRAGQHTLPTPPSVSSCKPKVGCAHHTQRSRAARRAVVSNGRYDRCNVACQDAEGNGAAVNSATVVGAARLLARQTHEKALKFLQKMPQAVAFQALELLKVSLFDKVKLAHLLVKQTALQQVTCCLDCSRSKTQAEKQRCLLHLVAPSALNAQHKSL